MGLDITAYRNLTKIDEPQLDESGEDPDCQYFHASQYLYDFSAQFGKGQPSGLMPGAYYDYADSMGFRAGSYGGYGTWRRELAKLAGYTGAEEVWANPPPEGPFLELIHFADNEGFIGPVVSAKLTKDFAAFKDKAEKHPDLPWFFELYCKWQQAFEMAADNGAVDFH